MRRCPHPALARRRAALWLGVIRKRHRPDRPAVRLAALADRIARHPYVPVIRERAGQYARLMRLDRPVGIFLLLWPTLWALWIAGLGRPDPGVVVVFVLGYRELAEILTAKRGGLGCRAPLIPFLGCWTSSIPRRYVT